MLPVPVKSSRTFGLVLIGMLLSMIIAMPGVNAFHSIVDGPQRRPLSFSARNRLAIAVVPESSSFSKEEDEAVDPTLTTAAAAKKLSSMERAWRHVKKPLLRLGTRQGATLKHGNSLRELLQQHTMVKVKIQLRLSRNDDDSNDAVDAALRDAFQPLRDYAVQSGASPDIELLQVRAAERTLLIGLPGTRQQIEAGLFPPPPPTTIPSSTKEEEEEDL